MNAKEFTEYLKINKHSLDEEIMQHPSLLFKIADAYVATVAERDALKEQLTATDAELDVEIREKLEGEKFTEAVVRNLVQLHERHVEAWAEYSATKKQADVLGALKEAFVTRGHMLRDLVQLHTTQYWENTSVTGADPEHRRVRQRLAEARERRS